MLVYMPTAGKDKLSAALANGSNPKITIGSFQIGEDIGFTPNPAYGIPEPFSSYTGSNATMRGWYVSPYFLAIQCILPHNVGGFEVGNVMIFDTAGVPIVGGVCRVTQSKYSTIETVRAGNHIVLTVGLRSASKKNLASVILLNNIGTNNAAIIKADTELDIPKAAVSRIGIANIDAHTNDDKPAAAFKLPNDHGPDTWLGMALYPLADAADNTVRGGEVGDGYA